MLTGGGLSLQIIEESQIDRNDPKQRAVWSSATHFNPVDLVCGVRDFDGRKFDLPAFIDPATVAITRKSEKGRSFSRWNGPVYGMGRWLSGTPSSLRFR